MRTSTSVLADGSEVLDWSQEPGGLSPTRLDPRTKAALTRASFGNLGRLGRAERNARMNRSIARRLLAGPDDGVRLSGVSVCDLPDGGAGAGPHRLGQVGGQFEIVGRVLLVQVRCTKAAPQIDYLV